jgi:anti-sigma regulatory factor (Ser/Thr protein kinase)
MSYVSIFFPGSAMYLSEVRRFTAKVLGDVPGVDDVVHVASELSANAIQHTASGEPGGTFTLHLAAFSDRWQVRVDDQGAPTFPRALSATELQNDEAGRGLAVVSELASTWGVLGDQYSRAVWAEVVFPCATDNECADPRR